MPDLDIEQFWKDEETAHEDNCFSKNTKQDEQTANDPEA
jgi:hypothetical protein